MRIKHHIANHRLPVFAALWGLIVAKCYILEYWVRIYSVPINSKIYIWSLTLLMATVASYVLLNLSREENGGNSMFSEVSQSVKRIVVAGLTGTIVVLALGWTIQPLAGSALQPYFAIILGASYAAIGLGERNNLFLAGGFTWFLSSALLLLLPHELTLFVFGCLILLLIVLPACLQLAHNWQPQNKISPQG